MWLRDIRIVNGSKTKKELYAGKAVTVRLDKEENAALAVMDSCPENEPLRHTLWWLDSMLPENKYLAVHAESLDEKTGKWTSTVGVHQPIKSKVFLPWNVAFWHKDSKEEFYGELFTFDRRLLRLHSETFPAPTPADPPGQAPWTASPERVRLFVEDKDGKDTRDMKEGRIMCTLDGSVLSDHDGYMDTFIASSYGELNARPRKFQENVHDHVFVTREKDFSAVYDGEMEGWPAEDEVKHFDEALIINQCMNDNAARERFIFARKGDMSYGVVRWDNSVMENGEWKVIQRATALKVADFGGPFPFDGFYKRVINEKRIAPAETAFTAAGFSGIPGSITVTNAGSRKWKSPEVWARLRNSDFSPAKGAPVCLARGGALDVLQSADFTLKKPAGWPKGSVIAEIDVTDGEEPFSDAGKQTFVRFINLR
ncbi:MAG: hypothetical protein ILO36_00990 [Abditibacteriota bacterium]|nr:hypothetical protein [Abditibacteriota bacterium]